MDDVKIVEIKENLAERYAPYADGVREKLKAKKTYLLNVMCLRCRHLLVCWSRSGGEQ